MAFSEKAEKGFHLVFSFILSVGFIIRTLFIVTHPSKNDTAVLIYDTALHFVYKLI